MNCRNTLCGVLLLSSISWTTAFAQQASLPMMELNAEGEIQIGPDGQVRDYRLTTPLAPAVANLVDRSVRKWTFLPVLVAGVPVIAKTSMHLHLQALPASKDDVTLQVVGVDFGEPKRNSKIKPPSYPEAAVHAFLGARVLLSLKLDAQGNVTDIHPYQTSLDKRVGSESEAERWRRVFEKASIAAAKNWHFDMTETVNGQPVGTTAMFPIEFAVTPLPVRRNVGWKAYLPGPVHPTPWLDSKALADTRDVSTLKEGEPYSVDSQFKLKNSVIGNNL